MKENQDPAGNVQDTDQDKAGGITRRDMLRGLGIVAAVSPISSRPLSAAVSRGLLRKPLKEKESGWTGKAY
jgi:hypothetical protein